MKQLVFSVLAMLGSVHHVAAQTTLSTAMRPRWADPRIAFLTIPAPQPASDSQTSYITRYRLEKRHPAERVSDVVRSIAFLIDPSVPEKWRPWVEQGIKAWLPVFASIGFRNALAVTVATTPQEEIGTPTDTVVHIWWSPNVHSPITITPTTDPQTGEILGTAILIPSTISDYACRISLIYLGDFDAQHPMTCADSVQGLLLKQIMTHEVGHALGLDHNFRGSSVYPTDSLRSPAFLRRFGSSASVMAYGPINYVAQPDDHVPFTDKLLRIGPYDTFALAWAYRPIPGATTSDEEFPTLERWRTAQDTAAYLRAPLPQFAEQDPGDQPGARGNDLTKSAQYGIRNVARTVRRMEVRQDALQHYISTAFVADVWQQMIAHVVDVVGGVIPRGPYPADAQKITLVPLDSAQQLRALQFILAHVFYGQDDVVQRVLQNTPSSSPAAMVLFDRMAPNWPAAEWQAAQEQLLDALLQHDRLDRLTQQSSTTHVLQSLCTELRVLRHALTVTEPAATDSASRQHRATLQEKLDDDVLSKFGACHS